MKFGWIMTVYIVVAALAGAAICYIEKNFREGQLETGRCYVLNDEMSFGLKYSFVHMIHKKGKNNLYLSEQWDQAAGWYGYSTVRHFPASSYTQITCPEGYTK